MIPPGEKIIETKTCRTSGQEFFVTDKDFEFLNKIAPTFAGKKQEIPSPTLCFDERRRRRLSFYNQKSLYKNTCAITGKEIISRIPPESWLTVYSIEAWSDRSWDPRKFAIDIDFSRSFFDQVHTLIRTTPYQNLIWSSDNTTNNALYTNHTSELKNCYLISNANQVSDAYYCTDIKKSEQCIDCLACSEAQQSYQCIACTKISDCQWCAYVTNSNSCTQSTFLKGCTNCLACINLDHKNYHILNVEVTPAQFQNARTKYSNDVYFRASIDAKFLDLCKASVYPAVIQINAAHSIGDTLYNVDNCIGFNITSSTNCRYCESIIDSHNLMDVSDYGEVSEYMYEGVSVGRKSQNILFSSCVGKWNNLLYCIEVKKSQDCFWCVNMHYVDHCILNKPYPLHEYESLCGKIIDHMRSTGEWWEFFTHVLSPFGYNETVAQEYFPMTQAEVEAKGWRWYNAPETHFEWATTTPLTIDQYDEKQVGYDTAQKNIDTLLNWIIQCEITKKPFKIIKQELAFYIEHHLPIPTKHPDQRHKERMDLRNPRTLHERTCQECNKAITTTYSPDRPERVVCEECYKKWVY